MNLSSVLLQYLCIPIDSCSFMMYHLHRSMEEYRRYSGALTFSSCMLARCNDRLRPKKFIDPRNLKLIQNIANIVANLVSPSHTQQIKEIQLECHGVLASVSNKFLCVSPFFFKWAHSLPCGKRLIGLEHN